MVGGNGGREVEFDGGLSFDETLMEVGGVNGGGTTLWDEAEG